MRNSFSFSVLGLLYTGLAPLILTHSLNQSASTVPSNAAKALFLSLDFEVFIAFSKATSDSGEGKRNRNWRNFRE